MNICLCKMTKELCRSFHNGFTYGPDLFMDMRQFKTYVYSPEHADAHFQRQIDLKREHLAIMLHHEPIGEIVLKNIDVELKHCTMGIHMKNDNFKNKGYGTQAEILALQYAFYKLGMETVFADAILKNTRSQHVLKKVGFIETHQDALFRYYKCDKAGWNNPSNVILDK